MVRVKYTDTTGCNDSVAEYPTIEEAWEAIYREIDDVAEYFSGREHHTLLFPNGAETYAPDGNERAEWKIINDFTEWLTKYARTPEELTAEMKNFAEMII